MFGESIDTLLVESPDALSNELLKTFDAALRGLGKRILLGKLRILFSGTDFTINYPPKFTLLWTIMSTRLS